jgi:tetratricopeptide (TPR) repeat protein
MNNRFFNMFTRSLCLIAVFSVTNAFSDEAFDRLVESKNYNEAIAYADAKLPSNTRDAKTWTRLGRANEGVGLVEKALACYMFGARLDVKNFEALLGMARIYNKLNQSSNAAIYAKKAMDIRFTGDASWEYAHACIALNKPAEAKKALEKVFETDPENVAAQKELGLIYYNEKVYDKAIDLMKTGYMQSPDEATAYKIGKAYNQTGVLDSALVYLGGGPNGKRLSIPEANLELLRIYYKLQKYDAYANEFEKIAAKSACEAIDYYQWAISLEKINANADQIVNAYRTASEKFGSSKSKEAMKCRFMVGKYEVDKKNYQAALVQLQAIYPDTGEVISLLATAYEGTGNSAKAISCLEKEIKMNSSDVAAYAHLGDLYTKEHLPEKARQIYEKMVSINPNDEKIQLMLGAYYLKAKRYQEALKYYQKSFTLERNAQAAEGMAIAAMALNKYDVARDAAESGIKIDPSLVESRNVLLRIYLKDKNYKDAAEQLEILLKKQIDNKGMWLQLAQCFEQTGDVAKLAEADRHIVSLDAQNTSSRLRLARYSMAQGDIKTAFDLYKELSPLLPGNADVFKNLSDISMQRNDKDNSLVYLKRYLALKPGDAASQKILGDILYDKKNTDGALAAYRSAVKADPAIKGVYKRYIEILMARSSEPNELVAAFSGAISTGEADAAIYAALGSDYHKRNLCSKAIDMFQKSLQLDPRNTSVFPELADCQAKTGNIKDAIVTYEQVVSMNSAAIGEYKELGDLYTQQKSTQQAISMYKKYLEKKPSDVKVALGVAENSFARKNYEEAAKYYEMVKMDETKNPDFLFRFAQASYYSKNYKRAAELCKMVTAYSPLNAEAFRILYDIASRDNSTKVEAAGYLKKYLALKPEDATAQKNLGDMLYEQKDFAGALAAYRMALKVDPKTGGIYKRYVELVMQRGTKEEIMKALSSAIAAGESDAGMYYELGSYYQKQGTYAKAAEMYQKSIQLDPKNIAVFSAMAQCQAKSGDVQQATVSYEQAIAMNPLAVQEYKALGDLYLQQNKKEQAMSAYKKYLDKDTSNMSLVMLVAEYEFKAKDFDEANKYLNMVHGEETKKTSYLLMQGQSCYQSKTCTKAAAIYKQLAVLLPQNPDVFKTLFDIANKSNNSVDAIAALKRYIALKPGDAAYQKQLGDLLYDQKDMSGAIAAYGAVIKADPSIKGFYKRYFEIAAGRIPQEQLISVLNAAVKNDEADAGMYSTLGNIYQKQNACDKAINCFQKSIQLDPRNTSILSSLAACQAKTGAVDDAVVSYEQVIAMNPDAKVELKALGDLYQRQNKSAQALAIYRKYLEKSPNDFEAARIVGENAMKEKKYSDAVKYFNIVMPTKGNDPEFLYNFGAACYYDAQSQTKNFKKAIELLERLRSIVKTVPHQASVLKMLADSYDQIGDTARAMSMYIGYTRMPGIKDQEASFRKAQLTESSNPSLAAKMYEDNTLLFPGDYRNFLHAGLYYSKRQATYDKAISFLKKCSVLADSIPIVWMEMGQVYGKLGKDKEEVEAYRQFIQRDPGNPEACGRIGEALLAKHNINDAMVFLETANALKPNDPKFMMLLSQGYIATDRSKEAIGLLEKTEKLRPDDINIKEQLYALYEKNGDSKNMLSEMKQILAKKKDNKYLLKYAQALYASGVYSEAENAVRDIRAVEPENIEALMLYARIQGIQGKWDDALETYKEISYINPNYTPALCERADLHLMQSKLQWAKTFYERALKSDPKYILAEIGLAKVARMEKNKAEYAKHIQNAQKLDPNNNNKALADEMQEGKKLLK